MEYDTEHPYVLSVKAGLRYSAQDPMFSGTHLDDFVDYLSNAPLRPVHPPTLNEKRPFVWPYKFTQSSSSDLVPISSPRGFERSSRNESHETNLQMVFLAGHPSPAWLCAVGHKYNVDPHFFQRHMSFHPSVQVSSYEQPALPSNTRYILRLRIPTLVQPSNSLRTNQADIQLARQSCKEALRKTFHQRKQTPLSGSPVIRRFYLHDWARFTLEQEISMHLVRDEEKCTILIWTDAGGEDENPVLPLSELPDFAGYDLDLKFCPTILDRPTPPRGGAQPPNRHCKTTQKFNILHRFYGRTLTPETMVQYPFYALHEIYAFAVAAENQFLNMMEQVLSERVETLTLAPKEETGPKGYDIQYDRNIVDQHRSQLKATLAFLTAQDDPVWFPPASMSPPSSAPPETVTTAMRQLIRDFQHVEFRAGRYILRCEEAMEIIASNAALAEARRSYKQTEGVARLTRLTTLVTILYVPSSFVCSFFGMNFAQFGQGSLSLWIWAAVNVPVLLTSLYFLRQQFQGLD